MGPAILKPSPLGSLETKSIQLQYECSRNEGRCETASVAVSCFCLFCHCLMTVFATDCTPNHRCNCKLFWFPIPAAAHTLHFLRCGFYACVLRAIVETIFIHNCWHCWPEPH